MGVAAIFISTPCHGTQTTSWKRTQAHKMRNTLIDNSLKRFGKQKFVKVFQNFFISS